MQFRRPPLGQRGLSRRRTTEFDSLRGYYWRSALWALDWRDGKLTQRWLFDTAAVKGATGKDGKLLQSSQGYESQGLTRAPSDVDGDGFDEIVYGSMTVDHDGQGLCSTG